MARPADGGGRRGRGAADVAVDGSWIFPCEGLRHRRARLPALGSGAGLRGVGAPVLDPRGQRHLLRVSEDVWGLVPGAGDDGGGTRASRVPGARSAWVDGGSAGGDAALLGARAAAHHGSAGGAHPAPAAGEPGAHDVCAIWPCGLAVCGAGPRGHRPGVGRVRPPDDGGAAVWGAGAGRAWHGRAPDAGPGDQPHGVGQPRVERPSRVVPARRGRHVPQPGGVGDGLGGLGGVRPTPRGVVGLPGAGVPHVVSAGRGRVPVRRGLQGSAAGVAVHHGARASGVSRHGVPAGGVGRVVGGDGRVADGRGDAMGVQRVVPEFWPGRRGRVPGACAADVGAPRNAGPL